MVEDFIHTDVLLGLSDPCKTNFIMFQQGAPVLSLKTSLVASASQIPVSDFKVLDKDILIDMVLSPCCILVCTGWISNW